MINQVKQCVLVVEDEPSISNVCQRVLIAEGFAVEIAQNGKIAQEMIAVRHYDLCLIDIRTPVMSGKELYTWMLERYPLLAQRVIFTTGDIMDGDTPVFLERSAQPFLPKPFAPHELSTIIKNACKIWNAHQG